MKKIKTTTLYFLSLALILFFINSSQSIANDTVLDTIEHGMIGIETGPGLYTGRHHIVDGITGATLPDKKGAWSQYKSTTGLVLDLGIPTSPKWLDGTVGFRLVGNIGVPTNIYDFSFMARYRFKFDLPKGKILSSIEPWAGAGLGFHFAPNFTRGVFIQLPMSAGLDFGIGKKLLLTTSTQLNTLNPFGPTNQHIIDGETKIYNSRIDSYMFKIGLSYRFY